MRIVKTHVMLIGVETGRLIGDQQ